MAKINILIISTNADEAGAPKHVETIANGLQDDFQFILIFGENGPVTERLKGRGYIVHVVHEMRTAISPINDLIALIKILFITAKYKPDIIHCHSAKAGMLGRLSAFICGKKWIYTVHGWGWRGASRLTKALIICIELVLSKLPRGFYLFVAKDVQADGLNTLRLCPHRGTVIYNGVPSIDVALPNFSQPLNVMMPARVSSAKDHQSLILAFENINDPNMRLLLCGTGTDLDEFKKFAKALAPTTHHLISFLGQRSDIYNVYAQSHIVALISNFEALPLSIIESMSCSRSIIATNVGGVPELISSDLNGILVRSNCIKDITSALTRLKDERLRAKLGSRARIAYEEKFTEKAMLRSIAHTYQKIAGVLNEPIK